MLAIGAIGLTLCQGMIYTGLSYTDATTAGIIMALSPIMTMVLARFVLGEPLGVWKALGALLALVGMVVIVARGDLTALMRLQFNPGELWIVGSAFCWGLYTVLLRRSKFAIELLPMVVLLLAAGALAALPLYLWELFSGERSALHANGLLALAYVAGPGGALMYYLYNRSVETLGAGRASMLLYLQTVFVAVLAYLSSGKACTTTISPALPSSSPACCSPPRSSPGSAQCMSHRDLLTAYSVTSARSVDFLAIMLDMALSRYSR